ncbi:MAG: DUF4870 domain-containing protein [Planctomycetota bacterium]|jgi:uncharacterized Tic20 family protein
MHAAPENGVSPRERREAALAHGASLLGFFLPLGNVLGPIFILLTAGKRSPFVESHALQSVVYQGFVSLLAWSLFLLAWLHHWKPDAHFIVLLLSFLPVLWAFIQAGRGRAIRYPLLWRILERRVFP